MKIPRAGSQPSAKGPAEYFTGTVRNDQPFQAEEPGRASGAPSPSSRAPEPPGTPIR